MELPGRWALLALGSYGRNELCPGSDVDVLLLHDGREPAGVTAAAEALWYPLWDAGFVLGHAVRTPKQALALAREQLDALTALLGDRLVMGDEVFVRRLRARVRRLAHRRRRRLVAELWAASSNRFRDPGPVAEMLEPNLKEGAGGLRDLESLAWISDAINGSDAAESGARLDALARHGVIERSDIPILLDARRSLLDARVALHRASGGRSDVLTLQDQDAVADELGRDDADALMRELAGAARSVTWIGTEAWRRLAESRRPGRGTPRSVRLAPAEPVSAAACLRVATDAARAGRPIERASLERMRGLGGVAWDTEVRDQLIALLRTGHAAIPPLEALDQVGVLLALFPEWAHVQARPPQNADHPFTVDRHLLECVAECAELLDEPGFDGDVARRVRPELLLLGALLHDLGKGLPGDDHSETGERAARVIAARMALDAHAVDVVAWLVRHHLLLADTATRRDLADRETIVRFGRTVRDTERLDLLYALTVGDSRATGPSAWSTAKATLVRQLFVAADSLLERGVVGPGLAEERMDALARHRELLARRELAVTWEDRDDGLVQCTVVAPDRTGLLATVTAVLALHGFDIRGASAYGDESGMALEVYRGVDTFERLDAAGRQAVTDDVAAAVAGTLPVRDRLEDRIRRYRRDSVSDDTVHVRFDLDASSAATVCEVDAPDAVGLLARIAAVFADLDIDVSAALVSTLGERVVDVFYVQDAHGAKLTEPLTLDRLRATIVARLTADTILI